MDEAYTTKTCGNCEELNWSLEGGKTFGCLNTKCKMVMDRVEKSRVGVLHESAGGVYRYCNAHVAVNFIIYCIVSWFTT